jgi:dTDP-4-amino-4,6-dideoxygalactose transaminase
MLNTKFTPWPKYTKEEARVISKILLSNKVNYWTGDECRKFEMEFKSWTDSKYAVALFNGTIALDVALHALEIKEGDEVIVTSRTFIASISSIVNAGAKPVFADVNCDTQNIDINTIRHLITHKTKAVICVHLAGWPCDMDPIMKLAKEFNLFVIEDCAQAHGARYKGRSVGSIGHIGAWSFCQDKIMTTGGEGGMATTNDESLWRKMWAYKDHGKSHKAVYEKKHPSGFRWVHESFGTNWRMTEIQAAIGRIQIKKMSKWTQIRNANIFTIYQAAEKLSNIRVPRLRCSSCKTCNNKNGCINASYKCYVFVKGDVQLRDKIMNEINSKGVPCYSGSCSEVYLEKAFENSGFRPKKRLPVAKALGESSLMFLVHPTLTRKEIDKTCEVLTEVALANIK